MAIVDIMC